MKALLRSRVPVVAAVAIAVTAGLGTVPHQASAASVSVTDLTPATSPFTLSRMITADAIVSFRVVSEGGQSRDPVVLDSTKATPFARATATLTTGNRSDGTWQAAVRLGSFMDGTHSPRIRVCVTDSTCIRRQLTTELIVRGADWPALRGVSQQPQRLPAGKVTGATAEGRVVFSDTHDPVPGISVRLVRMVGGTGGVVDETGGEGRFTSPWPWRQPGEDAPRLALTTPAIPGVRIDGAVLGNPDTRFLVASPKARALVAPGKSVTVRGRVRPGYPAARLGYVELQVLTDSGWITRDRAHVRPVTTAAGPLNQARYRLSTRFDARGKHVLRVVKRPAMCGSGGCRVSGNTSKPFPVLVGDPAYFVERRLNSLNVPVGVVDGTIDARSRQGFCAWRDMTGQTPSRRGVTPQLLRSVMRASTLPEPGRANGLYVNKTCQVLMQVKHREFRRIVWVSTGMPGHETPNGTGAIFRKVQGWVESSLYPGAYMLDPMFFFPDRPGIAIHGSVTNDLVHPYPASHGCIRTWRPQVRKIFNESPIGTKVKVYGHY